MICELLGPAQALAVPALAELRPDVEDLRGAIADLAADGYRMAGVIVSGESAAVAVAGFVVGRSLAWGRYLYVWDLVTRAAFREQGHGVALMAWLVEQAQHESCDTVHLDSGVGPHRHAAHSLYHAVGMRIASHHFSAPVPPPGAPALPQRLVAGTGLSLKDATDT